LLPGSVSILRTVPHRYELIKTSASWSDAQNYCRQKYNDLATILSDTDWLRVNNKAASNGLTTYAWAGLYINKDNWRWSLNNLPLTTMTYVNWYPGFPDNVAGSTCGTVSIAGYWLNPPCTTKRPFICYS
ncbi:macrophage mannose receptor 1-like isoform X6, partial [Clarias magur]